MVPNGALCNSLTLSSRRKGTFELTKLVMHRFSFPEALGARRFVKIGIPQPQFIAPFASVVEIVCGVF